MVRPARAAGSHIDTGCFSLDVVSIFRIVRARWKIVVPILLVTVFAAARIYTDKSTQYGVTGTQLLVAGRGQPAADAEQVAGVGTELLQELLADDSMLEQLTEEGLSDEFEIEPTTGGSTLNLDVVGESPEQAVETAARLIELAPGLLEEALDVEQGSVAVTEAAPGGPETATEEAGGYLYSTVVVVGTSARVTLNPFPASLGTVRSLVEVAESLPFLMNVAETGADASFEVSGNVREAPLIEITVRSRHPDEAVGLHQFIVAELRAQLDALQAGALIDPDARTQLLTLVDAAYPVSTPTSQLRPVAAVIVLGSGFALGLATVIEAIAADRRRRRDRQGDLDLVPADETDDETAESDETTETAGVEIAGVAESGSEPVASDVDEPAGGEPVVTGRRNPRLVAGGRTARRR